MPERKVYNNLSKKLRDELPKLKPGQKIRFQLNSVHYDKVTKRWVVPKSYALPSVCRIYDPWAIETRTTGQGATKKTVYEGDYVDIAYIVAERAAPADSNRDTITEFGRVEFLGTSSGIIEIEGGNMDHAKLLPLLFFNNKNKTNVGKPWYVKDGNPIFHQMQPEKKAEIDLEKETRIDSAKQAVMDMGEEELDSAAIELLGAGKARPLSQKEKIMELRGIAERSPEKILTMSKDVGAKVMTFIEKCVENGLLHIDKKKSEIQWPDDGQKIVSIKSNQTAHTTLKRFFLTDEGKDVLKTLETQLEVTLRSKKQKTSKASV